MLDKLADRLVTALETGANALGRIADALATGTAVPTAATTTVAAPVKPAAPAKAADKPAKPVIEAKPPKPAPAAVDEPSFDYEVLKASVIQLASTGAPGKAAAMGILSEFKVAKASEAPASQWEAMHARVLEEQAKLTAPAAAEEDDFA